MVAEAFAAFVEFARRTYGDLRAPDFSVINNAIEKQPYSSVVRRLADFCVIEDEAHNSWHDDVALCVILSHHGQSCFVWMSYVAPYAAVYMSLPANRGCLRDDDFVYRGSAVEGWVVRVMSVLESSGFWVLSPRLLRMEMEFYSVNDGEVQLMPLSRVFFSDLEDLFQFE